MAPDFPARLALSDAERDGGPHADTLDRGRTLFAEHGALVVDNLLPRAFVDALAEAYLARYGAFGDGDVDGRQYRTGAGRVLHPLRIAAPFDAPALLASPFVLGVLGAAMAPDPVVLNSASTVVAHPGAPAQRLHRDYEPLFGDAAASFAIPTYAVTLGVPLVDLDDVAGTTAMHPGSHRRATRPSALRIEDAAHPHLVRGSAYLMDYRLVHGGAANRGPRLRPIVYLVYTRPWWIDAGNYLACGIPSLVIDDATLARLQPGHAALFMRARIPLATRGGFP